MLTLVYGHAGSDVREQTWKQETKDLPAAYWLARRSTLQMSKKKKKKIRFHGLLVSCYLTHTSWSGAKLTKNKRYLFSSTGDSISVTVISRRL